MDSEALIIYSVSHGAKIIFILISTISSNDKVIFFLFTCLQVPILTILYLYFFVCLSNSPSNTSSKNLMPKTIYRTPSFVLFF